MSDYEGEGDEMNNNNNGSPLLTKSNNNGAALDSDSKSQVSIHSLLFYIPFKLIKFDSIRI